MIFYLIVIAIFIGILIHQYITFTRIYYTNSTLNKLMEIRHKAIMYLSENVKEKMPLENVVMFRGFLAVLGVVISEINSIKGGEIGITYKNIKLFYGLCAIFYNLLLKTIIPNNII